MSVKITRGLISASLATSILFTGIGVANSSPAIETGRMSNQISSREIGSPRWNSDIEKLKSQGKLVETNHVYNLATESTTYQIKDSKTGTRIGEFTVVKNKTAWRISGKWNDGSPAIIFNQDDQKTLQNAGAEAVTAMAAAWAASLAETVVGSVLSAGAVAFIGTVAADYLSEHGVCPGNQSLVVDMTKNVHCE